jgi:hypothetical protein
MGKLERNLPNDPYQAAINSASPSALNPFATTNDLGPGGGFALTGARNTNGVTDRDMRSGRVFTNITPFVIKDNCNLVGITAATSIAETWEAHVYRNGVSVASITITAADKGVSGNLAIPFVSGDEVRLRQENGTGAISRPRITAYFKYT